MKRDFLCSKFAIPRHRPPSGAAQDAESCGRALAHVGDTREGFLAQ